MTNKDIYLSLNRQDETSVKKLLTNHKLEKEYTYNNDYIEVVLKNNNKELYEERTKMSEKIDLLGTDYLPEIMVNNKEIYGILSKGIHELSEKECIENFPILFNSIEVILETKLMKDLEEKRKIDNTKNLNRINALLNFNSVSN